MTTKACVLVSYPEGLPKESNFEIKEVPLDENNIVNGSVLVQTLYISPDPYLRNRMKDPNISGKHAYSTFFELDKPIDGYGIGRVLKSKNENFKEGSLITAPNFLWQEKQVLKTDLARPISEFKDIPLSYHVGCLGMPGMTAYFGLLEIGLPKEGETVLVSGAAGAVGSLVGQIAKIKGCYVVGIAGGTDKCHQLKEWGFDDTIDYKIETDIQSAIRRTCPKGVDVYFDNVGGDILDAAIINLNSFGRIVLCGSISQYNATKPPTGPRMFHYLIGKNARAEGFIVHMKFPPNKYWSGGIKQVAQWIQDGKIKLKDTEVKGLENAPKAFISMLQGGNVGKMVVKVAE
jgi:NADPH-dependent curcumin reductase CurA